jgi:hypothetical protein
MVRFETTDSEGLDLPTDVNVTVTSVNPVFDSENADRSFSYPLKLAWTPQNIGFMAHTDRVDAVIDVEEIGVAMIFDETLFETGVGVIESDSDVDFELTFKSNTAAILNQLEQLQIGDLVETIQIPQTFSAEWAFNIPQLQGATYSLTVNDQRFHVNKVSGFNQSVPMNALANSINAVFPSIAAYSATSNIFVLSDPQNIYPELKISNYTEGLEIRSGWRNHSQAKQLNFIEYMKSQFSTPSVSHRFPMLYNPEFYPVGKRPESWTGFINYQKRDTSGQLTQGTPIAGEKLDTSHSYIPFVRLRYILDKISTRIKLPITFNFLEYADLDNLLIVNNVALDEVSEEWFTDAFTPQYFPVGLLPKRRFLNHFKTEIALKNHVINESAKDFLTRVGDCFESYFVVENGALAFKKKQDVVNTALVDWSNKLSSGFSRKRKKRIGFALDYTRNSEDAAVMGVTHPTKYVSQGGGNVVNVPFHTLPILNVAGADMLHSVAEGSSSYDGAGQKPFLFAMVFDRGLQLDTDNNSYYKAAFETPTLSLAFEGVTGLFAHFFEGVVELLDGSTYTFVLNLSAYELADLRTWTAAKRYFETDNGTVLGVVRMVQFKVSRKGIEAARVEVVSYP